MSMVRKVVLRYTAMITVLTLIATTLVGVPNFASAGNHDFPGGDCDDNAVMRCGVKNVSSLKTKYRQNQNGDVKEVFDYFGMDDTSDFNGMVRGEVTRWGNVRVDGKKVATNATTAGRHHMPGSTKILNGDFYKRSPSVSFRSDSLDALVKLDKDGEFEHAVIMSCGNPIKAKAVKSKHDEPKPEPEPEPEPKPEPHPDHEVGFFYCKELDVFQTDDLTYRFTVSTEGENADIQTYEFDFGDGRTRTIDTMHDKIYTHHTYRHAGDYDASVRVTARVDDGGRANYESDICHANVFIEDFEEPEPEPEPKPEPKPEPEPEPEPEPSNPDVAIHKDVRVLPDETWVDEQVEAERGDTIQYRITIENTGDTYLTDVMVHDTLASGLDFESDSLLDGSSAVDNLSVGDLVGNGITISRMNEGETITIYYDVIVSDFADACDSALVNIARVRADDVDEDEDDAFVRVCPPEEPEPEPEPQVRATQTVVESEPTPPELGGKGGGELPKTGAVGAFGVFSVSSILGYAAYKLKDFYLLFLR